MKIFDLMKKAKVKKIGVRLCNSVEDAKKKSYEESTSKSLFELYERNSNRL